MKQSFYKKFCLTMSAVMVVTSVSAGPTFAMFKAEKKLASYAATSAATATPWTPMTAYAKSQVVSYNGVNYECIQPHTSLPGWEPAGVPALWGIFKGSVTPPIDPPPIDPPTPGDIEVASVSLNKTQLDLEVGKTSTLLATVTPNNATDKTVKWTTENASVVTVINGVVTAKSEGTTKVIATAGAKTASCSITVTKTPVTPPVDPDPEPDPDPNPSRGQLPGRVLTGYWQNFINNAGGLKLADVPKDYHLVCVSFADATQTPGEIVFNLDSTLSKALGGYTNDEFKNDIKKAHEKGQKVIISIGGEVGNVIINSPAAAQKFADSAYKLMQEYGFDGVDIDLEHGIDVPNLSKALHLLAAKAGPDFILAMAPQTLDVYTYNATYLKLARETKDILTIMNTQYYNSGVMPGYDDKNYSQGSIGFLNAIATTQLEAGLRPDQIGIGVPAVPAGASSGFQSISNVVAAIESLVYGKEAGGFTPPKAYNDFRGAMTWSINWDATNNYAFAKAMTSCFAKLPPVDSGVIDPPTPPQDIKVTSVTLSQTQADLKIADKLNLAATVAPSNATNKAVSWSTNNSSVATVQNGVVTAKKEGTAVITATADGKSATCTVTVTKTTVTPPEDIRVTSVTLPKTNADLKIGESLAMSATVAPSNATNKTISWSTNNSSVATVKNGVITAKKEGTAVITATADGKSATCTVTVTKAAVTPPEDIRVTEVILNQTEATLEVSKAANLSVTISPVDATNKTVTWTTSNSAVATVKNGVVMAVKEGTAVITATADGKSATCNVTVTKAPVVPPIVDDTQPPHPFWKDYQNYPIKGTQVYYKGNIYQNKWYANAGAKPDTMDPWELVGKAEWTVTEDEKNYQKDPDADSNQMNKILSTTEINKLYGGIKSEYSPESAVNRLNELIPESYYNELFPYRFGSEAWKNSPSTKAFYPDPSKLPDYYSYQNLKKAIETLSNTIVKVQWYEGSEWCYRIIRLNKTTKEQRLIFTDPSFNEDWIQNSKTLMTSVCDYGSFLAVGDLNTRKRELAGFLANISHETGGGSIDGIISDNQTGLYFNEEVGFIGSNAIGYVQGSGTSYLPVAGKSYHGRGPIQLSYNYNYGLCSDVLFGDSSVLLKNPEKVSEDGVLGLMTGIWFWMTPQPPKPSCHEVITGIWQPKQGAANASYNKNFGLTIIIINNEAGQSETGVGAVARRARYYRLFAGKMGADITGEHCDTMGMTTFTQK